MGRSRVVGTVHENRGDLLWVCFLSRVERSRFLGTSGEGRSSLQPRRTAVQPEPEPLATELLNAIFGCSLVAQRRQNRPSTSGLTPPNPTYSTMTSSDALTTLARYRHLGARESTSVLKLGRSVLGESETKLPGLREAEWAVREQVAVAALDLGDLEYANVSGLRLLQLLYSQRAAGGRKVRNVG